MLVGCGKQWQSRAGRAGPSRSERGDSKPGSCLPFAAFLRWQARLGSPELY